MNISLGGFSRLFSDFRDTVLLLGGVLVAVSFYFALIGPDHDEAQAELEQAQGDLVRMRAEFERLEDDIQFAEANGARFAALLDRSRNGVSGRLATARTIERMAQTHGLAHLSYTLEPEALNEKQSSARIRVVETPIQVDVTATLDSDILAFIEDLQRQMQGVVRVDSLELDRMASVDESTLAILRGGQELPLIAGSIGLTWQALHEVSQ